MSEEELNVKKSEIAQKEEEILKFWQDNKIFEKTLEKEAPKGNFTFYDGPPFATGTPHYGHLIAGTIKDVIPRYKTMQGYYVRRRWGWDCHGLPVENIVEKELGLKSKKGIIDYGVENFNNKAREVVLRYTDEWKNVVPRLGRFVDMEDDYRTMDASYSETTWWIFKQLFDKGLIYEGYKSMHICPRCETTLSNFEVTQGYKDVTDISVTAKFELLEEPGTFVLAWTTTPWTIPGNVALAVGVDVMYVKALNKETGDKIILSKRKFADLAETVSGYEVVEKMKGQDLIGKKYKPVFDYYANDEKLEHHENGWKIYGADFVTIEDGTGVVHIAPAFGEDDMNLGKENNLPFIQHVGMNGAFKPEVKDWPGLFVKPKDNPQSTDIEVLKYLAGKGTLFAKEKFTHSYPHCWRCDTPLLNYATSSWFIKVSSFRDKLVEANKQVNWVPDHVREGRFGKWLEGARDWAISRTRFWGAPLPVWRCADCGATKVFGSIDELVGALPQSNNKYWGMRHGESESNLHDKISVDPNEENHLTEKGRGEVVDAAEGLKEKKIDLVIASNFVRTKETAEIVAKSLGLSPEQVIFDERLGEIRPGDFLGGSWREYNLAFGSRLNRLHTHLATGGENYNDVRKRVMAAIYDIDKEHQGKNILLISHGLPLFMAQSTILRRTDEDIIGAPHRGKDFANAEVRSLNFVPVPHNRHYELDLHRPFIDEISFSCSCGSEFKRVPDVFDCWYESGSMPYAQDHYPFKENSPIDPVRGLGFPANFISEGLDQTRGWFYSLIVLGVALFDKSPYENVVTNGLVLAEDGQKMSKHLKNYPDPMDVANRLGADALRLYLMSSPAVHGEDLLFSEKGVVEIGRKIISRLLNVLSFYQLYVEAAPEAKPRAHQSLSLGEANDVENVLDVWILARLKETVESATSALERYEIDRAIRPIDDFIEDLSTWYLRRSRDRFKEEGSDKEMAIAVTKFILQETSKVLAPFAPFVAEMIYQELRTERDELSVHLTSWPKQENQEGVSDSDKKVLEKMAEARRLVSLGLEFRQAMKIKVRQPLAELKVKNGLLAGQNDYIQLIGDELNVKEITFNQPIEDEVWLDGEVSEDLLAEGTVRELVRQIQERRKRLGLNPNQLIDLAIEADSSGREILRKFEKDLAVGTNTKKIDYAIVSDGELIEANERPFKIKISIL
ncbi:MAG: class I tRNA ligase family protein [Candidatus Paceibacterota bacterium]